jgi:hypothetical protein
VWSPFIRAARREPWNKGKVVGQKAPFKLKDIWSIRIRVNSASEDASWRCSILQSWRNLPRPNAAQKSGTPAGSTLGLYGCE